MNRITYKHNRWGKPVLLSLALLCSCSPPSLPHKLAGLIASADHVVASDRYAGYRITLSGDEARRLIAALCAAERDKNCYSAIFGCHVDFYAGTNLLVTIRCQDRAFWAGTEQYSEGSGVLKALQKDWESDETGAKNWIDDLAGEVTGNTNLTGLQSWALQVVDRYRHGQVRTRPGLTYRYPELCEQDLPEWVLARFRGWEIYVLPEASGEPECVLLNYHCMAGVVVGPKDYPMSLPA